MRNRYMLTCALILCLAVMAGSVVANQLTNPGFEAGITAEWHMNTWGGTSQLITDSAVAHSGQNCMFFDAGGENAWIGLRQLNVPGIAGKYYRFSAWLKVPDADVTSADWTFRVNRGAGGENLYTATVATSDWTRIVSGWYLLPVGQSLWGYVGGYLSAPAGTPAFYTDDWAVEQSDPAYVTGRVVDNNGNPIAGARVVLDSYSYPLYVANPLATATTNASGNYTMIVPPVDGATTYYVDAISPIHYEWSGPQSVTLPPSPATAPDIVLYPYDLCTVSGKLTSKATGLPVEGVKVTASMDSGGNDPNALVAVSDANGDYSIQLIAGQVYYLNIRKFGVMGDGGVREWEIWTLDENYQPRDVVLNIQLVPEEPLVAVSVADLEPGVASSVPNAGTLGGVFEAIGTGPVVGKVGPYEALSFNNNSMVLRIDGVDVLAPASITGRANYTVSAWLLNPELAPEECYISWARRGGPDGTCSQMNYGSNASYGAVTHWGGPDMGFGTNGAPPAGAWHHIAITYDGVTEIVYVNGVEAAREDKVLSIYAENPILLGSAYWYDVDTQEISPDIVLRASIGDVRIYASAASAEDIPVLKSATKPIGDTRMITGKVTKGTTPLAGVAVRAGTSANIKSSLVAAAVTDQNGDYAIEVGHDTYYVMTYLEGHASNPGVQVVPAGTANAALPVFVLTASTISGVVKDAVTGQPIYNAVVQTGGVGGAAMVTIEDGAYTLPGTGCGGVELFVDALGYRCKNMLVTGYGDVTKTVVLIPEEEDGVIVNGDMEQPFTNDWVKTDWGSATFMRSTDARHGQYSLWYTNQMSDYGGVRQDVQLTPGYTYTWYMTAKADAGLGAWQPMFEFSDDAGGNWNGFVSAEEDYREWYHTPPRQWMTYLKWFDRGGTHNGPAVRVTPVSGATKCYWVCLIPAQSPMPDSASGAYIDSAVIDKVPVDEPLVTVAPDSGAAVDVANLAELKGKAEGTAVRLIGNATVIYAPRNASNTRSTNYFYIGEKQGLGGLRVLAAGDGLSVGNSVANLTGTVKKTAAGEVYLEMAAAPSGSAGVAIDPLGMNNKSVATDAKAQTNAVRVWGKVSYSGGATFTVTDGYADPIAVQVNGIALPAGLDGKTAVISGVVSKNDAGNVIILAQSVTAL